MARNTKNPRQESALIAARAHTNLTVFNTVVSILEGGNVYSSITANTTADEIIRLCKAEMARQLKIHDIAMKQIK